MGCTQELFATSRKNVVSLFFTQAERNCNTQTQISNLAVNPFLIHDLRKLTKSNYIFDNLWYCCGVNNTPPVTI